RPSIEAAGGVNGAGRHDAAGASETSLRLAQLAAGCGGAAAGQSAEAANDAANECGAGVNDQPPCSTSRPTLDSSRISGGPRSVVDHLEGPGQPGRDRNSRLSAR